MLFYLSIRGIGTTSNDDHDDHSCNSPAILVFLALLIWRMASSDTEHGIFLGSPFGRVC